MSDEHLDAIDKKSLLQANVTILAGALIFLTLFDNTGSYDRSFEHIYDSVTKIFFMLGFYFIIASTVILVHPKKISYTMRKLPEKLCAVGLIMLFVAVPIFLWKGLFSVQLIQFI